MTRVICNCSLPPIGENIWNNKVNDGENYGNFWFQGYQGLCPCTHLTRNNIPHISYKIGTNIAHATVGEVHVSKKDGKWDVNSNNGYSQEDEDAAKELYGSFFSFA